MNVSFVSTFLAHLKFPAALDDGANEIRCSLTTVSNYMSRVRNAKAARALAIKRSPLHAGDC